MNFFVEKGGEQTVKQSANIQTNKHRTNRQTNIEQTGKPTDDANTGQSQMIPMLEFQDTLGKQTNTPCL